MKLLIFDFETKELLSSLELPSNDSLFHLENEISKFQEQEDILKLGKTCVVRDLGIKEFFRKGFVRDSMSQNGSIEKHTSDFSMVYGYSNDIAKEPDFVSILDENKEVVKTTKKIGLVSYECGWVLNTGKESTNIFGGRNKTYLKSIGTRNFRGAPLGDCRLFKDKKALLTYVTKNKDALHFLVERYGYYWEVEPCCSNFEEDYNESLENMTTNKKTKEEMISKELEELLSSINADDTSNEDTSDLPQASELTYELMKKEALQRMRSLDLYSKIINEYENSDKIYFSEFGGMLYDLDEIAKRAVAKCRELGYVPYHVVKTNTTFGNLVQVLYVSNDVDNWPYERKQKNDCLYNLCYMENVDDYEFGESKFVAANGGLVRTA